MGQDDERGVKIDYLLMMFLQYMDKEKYAVCIEKDEIVHWVRKKFNPSLGPRNPHRTSARCGLGGAEGGEQCILK